MVLLLVDRYDLATIAALRYARGLRPTVLRAVHFSLDGARADRLSRQWVAAGTGIPLELADCPDRRSAVFPTRRPPSCPSTSGTRWRRRGRSGPSPRRWTGRAHIAGIEPGNRIRLEGKVAIGADGRPTMINPAYELLT